MPSLDKLRPGQSGRVASFTGQGAAVQRLMEMGLFEGEEVELVAFAPMGDPLEIRLRDYRLSLRCHEAALVQIDLHPPAL